MQTLGILVGVIVGVMVGELVRLCLDDVYVVPKDWSGYRHGFVAQAGQSYEYEFFVAPLFLKRTCNWYWENVAVSLIIQGSLNNLRHLGLFLDRWTGPIELVVFLYEAEELWDLNDLLRQFLTCREEFMCRVSVHVVVTVTTPKWRIKDTKVVSRILAQASYLRGQSFDNDNVCWDLYDMTNLKSERQNFVSRDRKFSTVYPANLLRNVGRNLSFTPFHLVLDADVIPSAGIFQDLDELLKSESQELFHRLGLILPAFETEEIQCFASNLPSDKDELLARILENDSFVPFYQDVNPRVQELTNFKKWYRLDSESERNLSVAYYVEWSDPFEPFLVLHRSAPLYDQRFVQYGVNRLSQICELNVAGWNFAVLDKGFLIHCGKKKRDGFHPGKSKELNRNQKFYKGQFLEEIYDLYRDSDRSC